MPYRWVGWRALLISAGCLLAGMGCGASGVGGSEEGLDPAPNFSGNSDVLYAFPDGGSSTAAETGEEQGEETGEDSAEVGTEDTGDESGSDATEESGGESTEETGTETSDEDGESGEDTGSETGVGDGPAEVGEPCGAGISECVEGATCIEIASDSSEKACFEDAGPGEPCGPGVGQCAEGALCTLDPVTDGGICQIVKGTGEPCDGAGETCAPGEVCAPNGSVNGFAWTATWSPTGLSPATWSSPGDVAVDASGRIWIADTGNGRLVSLDSAGNVESAIDLALASGGDAVSPVGLDAPGDLVVADGAGKQLVVAGMDGSWGGALGGPGDGDGLFGDHGPGDVRVQLLVVGDDVIGATLLVTVPEEGRVDIFSAFGASTPLWSADWQVSVDGGETPLAKPMGITSSSLTEIWVADPDAGVVRGWADAADGSGGTEMTFLGGPTLAEGGLEAPTGVVVDAEGRVHVADPVAGHVAVFDASGKHLWWMELPGGEFAPKSLAVLDDQLVIVDADNDAVHLFTPTMGSVCMAPTGSGDACGPGMAPCAAGLSCLPTYPGSPHSICKSIQGENAPCGDVATPCGEGLACVTGDAASGFTPICLVQGDVGTSCGPGIGGCAEGAGCNWDGPAHAIRQCYPDLELGDACNGYATGDCPEASSCVQEIPGSTILVCRAWLSAGDPCNAAGTCSPWLSCSYDASPVDTRCLPFQQEGESCGLEVGDCEAGTACMYADATQAFAACLGPEALGDSCGAAGEGLCDETMATCQALQSGGPYQCMENNGEAGDVCGAGFAPCSSGTTCIYDDPPPNNSSLTCYAHGAENGAPCGIAHGPCDAELGLGCGEVDENYLGQCLPRQPDFAPCGAATGGVGACSLLDSECVCSDPTIGAAECDDANLVCVPVVDTYSMCAVLASQLSENATTGWVGLCPSNHVCVAGAGVAGDHFFYYCKPIANLGESCGMFDGCASGLSCICPSGQVCTVEEIQGGNVGTCTLN